MRRLNRIVDSERGAIPGGDVMWVATGRAGMLRSQRGRSGTLAALRSGAARASALPLELRFLAFSIVVLVLGAIVIGEWSSHAIESGVIHRTGDVAAVYVNGFLAPELQDETFTRPLHPETVSRLDKLLATELGSGIVSFKIWGGDGVVRYATDGDLIGTTPRPGAGFAAAITGHSASRISSLEEEENRYEAANWTALLETYAPIYSTRTGDLMAVAEFYQETGPLLTDLRRSQRNAWAIVGGAAAVMFLALNSLVRSASRTIRRQTDRLRDLAARARQVSAAKVQTDEAVLRRVSQDLHDGAAQNLALASLRIGAVREATRGTPAAADVAIVAAAVDRALQDVRRAATEMRAPDVEGLCLADIIRRAVAEHEHRSGDAVDVELQGEDCVPPGATAIAVYRVVMEALTNAARHAGSGRRCVQIERVPDGCRISIVDDGVGFETASAPEGLGRRGMRERAALLGGRVDVWSSPGHGTTVALHLPTEAL